MARTKQTARDHYLRENQRAEIAKLVLRGYSQTEIAERVGISQPQVSRDLKVIEERWKKSGVRDMDTAKAVELHKINYLETQYWEGWERSQQDAKESKARKVRKAGGADEEATMKTETQTGDPRFLDGVLKASIARRDLLGLDAPTKVAPTDPTGEKEYGQDGGISDEQRAARIAALFDAARARRSGSAAGDGQTSVEAAAGSADDGVLQPGG